MKDNYKAKLSLLYSKYSEIKRPTIFTIIVFFSCFFSFHILQNQIGIVSRVIFYLLAYISAQNIDVVIIKIKNTYSSVWERIILFIICMLATFCETGAYYLEPIYYNPIPVIPYFVMSFVWMSVIVLYLICFGHNWIINLKITENKVFSVKANLAMILICISLCMLNNYAFNPAITSQDSQYSYNLAFHLGEGPIADGHPVFYLLILSLCTFITSKIQFMIFVQAVFYALVFIYALNVLVQIGVSKKICVCIFFLVVLGFNSIIQITTLWKDIPFAVSLVWLTALLVKMCADQEKCSKKIGWYIQYSAASVLTSLIRHNGLLPVITTFVLAVVLLKNKKKIIIATLVAVLTIIFIKGPVYSRYQVYDVPGLKYYAMANDIMYLYYQEGGDDVIMPVVNDFSNGDPDNFPYSPYYTNETKANLNNYSVIEFLKIYFHARGTHPKTMMKAFLSRNSVIWSIDKPVNEIEGCVNYLGEYHNEDCPEQYPRRATNILTVILTDIYTKLTDNQFVYSLYWKTSIYNLLMIVGIMMIIVRFRKKSAIMILPFIPIVVNVAILFIASGWPDYRYYWPSMLVASILLPYTVIVLAKRNYLESSESLTPHST